MMMVDGLGLRELEARHEFGEREAAASLFAARL